MFLFMKPSEASSSVTSPTACATTASAQQDTRQEANTTAEAIVRKLMWPVEELHTGLRDAMQLVEVLHRHNNNMIIKLPWSCFFISCPDSVTS